MTAAAIRGFVTRAEAGLRRPRSISRAIWPQHGGTTGHYAGPDQDVSPLLSGHTRCVNLWRGYQRHHMDTRGWVDVAYTGAFCQHGYAFAGRGAGVRTAANGTNPGNDHFYAAVWIGGDGETPTDDARAAFAWWVRELRRNGAAGDRVVPHSWHKPTGCPGPHLARLCADLDRRPITGDTAMATRHFDQVVVGANAVDIEAARGKAALWDLALCVAKPNGNLEVVGPHSHEGHAAAAGAAILVGEAARPGFIDDHRFEHGTIRVRGRDRKATAAKLDRLLLNHPPGTIRRTGRPW